MTDLNPCRLCGGAAVEQTRESVEDYSWRNGVAPSSESLGSNTDANARDVRVICSVCDNSTGWMSADVADYMRFVWNRDNAAH